VYQKCRRACFSLPYTGRHGVKQRYHPTRGFGSFDAAARFCTAHDELRDHLRSRQHLNETVSLAEQRRLFQDRWGEVCAVLQAA